MPVWAIAVFPAESLGAQSLLAAVEHFLAPAGVLLLAHQLRRAVRCGGPSLALTTGTTTGAPAFRAPQILLDAVTRRPRLEDTDVPFVAFCDLAGRAGFHSRRLRSAGQGGSACGVAPGGLQEPGGVQVLAMSRCKAALAALPADEGARMDCAV